MTPVKKILIVDDERDVLETVRFRLELEGYEVIAASNGFEALGAFELGEPDLVLLDVMMPMENGYRVAHTIREREAERDRRVPIVLLTARDLSNDPQREEMFLEYTQADSLLYKPCDLDFLVEEIGALVGRAPSVAPSV